MKVIEITAKGRTDLGKKATKALRVNEQVPCVVYGKAGNANFYAHKNDFNSLVYTPNEYIVSLDIDGNKKTAIMQELQFHPVTDEILHIDFREVSEDTPVKFKIPVKLNGFPKGVQAGGKLQMLTRKLRVEGLVADFPDRLDIDVTDLELGKSIKISELNFDNINLLDAPNSVVCSVKLTRAAKGAATAEEEGAEETTEEEA